MQVDVPMTLGQLTKYIERRLRREGLEEYVKIIRNDDKKRIKVTIYRLGYSELYFSYYRPRKGYTSLFLVDYNMGLAHKLAKSKAVNFIKEEVRSLGGQFLD